MKLEKNSSVNENAVVTATKSTAVKNLKVKVKTSNKKIAAVKIAANPSAAGAKGTSVIQITGKKKGSCKITITTAAKNKKGKRLSKTIKVTVKNPAAKTSGTTGNAVFLVKAGSYTASKSINVSANTTYEMIIGVPFRDYQDTQIMMGLDPFTGLMRYTTIPAFRNSFTLTVTMPDDSEKIFNKNEKGYVNGVAFGAVTVQ